MRIFPWIPVMLGALLLPVQAAVSITRSLPSDGGGLGEAFTVVLTVDVGTPAPSALIVREQWPEGWVVTKAQWNGTAHAPSLADGTYRWLFGVGVAVANGTLRYDVLPTGTPEQTYSVAGAALYGTSTEVTTMGDSTIYLSWGVDTDGDGMPDAWEVKYGFDPGNPSDALQDADRDGMTNLAEYIAGTHPRDADDYLVITSFAVDHTGPLLMWTPSNAFRVYSIQGVSNMRSTNWGTINSDSRFFRVNVQLP